MKDTSLQAFRAHALSPALGEQQARIVRYLARNVHRDFTRAELAAGTGIRINAICPRCVELIAAQIVEELPRRKCRETGRAAHPLTLRAMQASLPLEAA